MGIVLGEFDTEELSATAEIPLFTESVHEQKVYKAQEAGLQKPADVHLGLANQPEPNLPQHTKYRQYSELFRDEVFEHYWMQGLNGGERSFSATAKEFQLTSAQVSSWFKQYHWQDRIDLRAQKIAKRMDERAVEKVSEIKTAYHRLIRGMVEDWFKMHFGDASNKALTLAATDVDAIVRLVKLDLVLLGAPDTIRQLEGTVVHQVDENIRALSTEDLKAIVNARKERKELPAADVIVHVEKIAPEATTLAETVSEEKH